MRQLSETKKTKQDYIMNDKIAIVYVHVPKNMGHVENTIRQKFAENFSEYALIICEELKNQLPCIYATKILDCNRIGANDEKNMNKIILDAIFGH